MEHQLQYKLVRKIVILFLKVKTYMLITLIMAQVVSFL